MPNGERGKVSAVGTSAGRIACREEGGSGPGLLFLHGSSFSKEVFDPLMREPSLAGFRRVAIDLPGHGESEDAADPACTYNVRGLARVVGEVVDGLSMEGCVLLGWSLGGDVAMELLDPGTPVGGVALVGAPPVPAGILGKLRGYTLTGALLAAKPKFSRAEALRFEGQCIGPTSDGRFVDILRRTDPMMRPHLARSALFGKGADQQRAVRASGLPVWLVAGERDPLLRIPYVRRFRASRLHGGEPWIVPAAGHAPFLDDVSGFAERLADFVRASETARGSPCADGSVPSTPDDRPASGKGALRRADDALDGL